MRALIGQCLLTLILGLFISNSPIIAQEESLNLSLTHEVDIGFDCPVASASQPKSDLLWVLMDNCFYGGYHLQAYDLITGEALADQAISLESIDGNIYRVTSFTMPMAFIDDTTLELIAYHQDEDRLSRFEIYTESGLIKINEEASQSLNEFLSQYTEYPDLVNYSPDHHYAMALNDESSYLLDLQSGELVKAFEDTLALAAFPDNMQSVFITVFVEPDNYDNYNAFLSVYTLDTMEAILSQIELPTAFIYPSADGSYVALQVDDRQLGILELDTQANSPLVDMWEEPHKALKCLNRSGDLSDVDLTVSGRLTLSTLIWRPDHSGLITLNSFGGEGAQGGRMCFFNYSRLRQYTIEDAGS